jgi:hypothetical protein
LQNEKSSLRVSKLATLVPSVLSVLWLFFFVVLSMPLSLFSLLDADPVEPFTQFMESYAYSGPIIGLLTGVFAVKLFLAGRPGFACILIWLVTFTWLLGSVLGTSHAEGLAMAADCQTV